MTKKERELLAHIKPLKNDFADVYFCHICKYLSDYYMYTLFDRVKEWAEKNGGTVERLGNEKIIIGEEKGFKVRIRFPIHCKRDMKEIMATLK